MIVCKIALCLQNKKEEIIWLICCQAICREGSTRYYYLKVWQSFLIYRDSYFSKKSLLLDESRNLKFLMLTETPQDNACSRMINFSLICKGSPCFMRSTKMACNTNPEHSFCATYIGASFQNTFRTIYFCLVYS